MIKVITYGTYDLLHYGHIRLLERAKELGDYLIVGVTADDFDKTRGKINVQQSLMKRIEAVRETGLADEIIIEEYEGQKIDDIKKYNIDIFTVGSDWIGQFDYLNEYCKVIYLERTQGISSSDIRTEKRKIRLGLVGESLAIKKFARECQYVNGIEVTGFCTQTPQILDDLDGVSRIITDEFSKLLPHIDALYISSEPTYHYEQIKMALEAHKHILCESPIVLTKKQNIELFSLAKANNCILMDSIKTAYSTAYSRLLLLAKTGKIGKILSVEATCTSLRDINEDMGELSQSIWNSICAWGPTALLPIFQLLGTEYSTKKIVSKFAKQRKNFDIFSQINFIYDDAVATLKVGKGVKSEGELIISGTKGYIYVPAPWWKTDYFEIRYENPLDNKRYFYQLDGEGIRYELAAFVKAIETGRMNSYVEQNISDEICKVIEDFYNKKDLIELR